MRRDWKKILTEHHGHTAREIAEMLGILPNRVYEASYRLKIPVAGPGSGNWISREKEEKMIQFLRENQHLGHTELGRKMGCSKQHVYGLRKKYKEQINEESS